MKSIHARLDRLEQAMKPEKDWDKIMGYMAAQIEAMECLGSSGDTTFPEPPEGVDPKDLIFMWGRNSEEWEASKRERAATLRKMMGEG